MSNNSLVDRLAKLLNGLVLESATYCCPQGQIALVSAQEAANAAQSNILSEYALQITEICLGVNTAGRIYRYLGHIEFADRIMECFVIVLENDKELN